MRIACPDLFEWARARPVAPVNPQARPLGEAGDQVRALWEVLSRDCRGMANACTAAVLGLRAGIKVESSAANRGRFVRDLIAAHMDDFGEPVLAMTSGAQGYYVPLDPAEMERGHVVIHSRQVEIAARDRAVVRAGKAKGWVYLGKGRWTE